MTQLDCVMCWLWNLCVLSESSSFFNRFYPAHDTWQSGLHGESSNEGEMKKNNYCTVNSMSQRQEDIQIDIGEHAAGPHSSIFLWDLHCKPWSSLKPPPLPIACVHTLWNVLVSGSCSTPKRIMAAWMQACMHAQTQSTFPPFTQWVLFTRVGVMGWGRERVPNHENLVIVNDLSLPVTTIFQLWRKRNTERTTLQELHKGQKKIKPFGELERMDWKRYRNVQT